ncbi:cupin domain-containing protein [Pseudonocardia spinosispora]|uniref:cupin domain-containing protein n=1 Tax=Pseudonocardia spinosispora TaxID=103441 RepID=UPI000419D998|nr:cupin domain-containing protein [Pseudonocardia spinosispora]
MENTRFILLEGDEQRPGRVPLPPAFAVKARSEDTEGRLSLLEVTLAHDIPRHVHHEADECIYVLEGVLEIDFEDHTHRAGPGMFAVLPRGVPHALRRGSTPPPRVLQISTPGGWECYVEDLVEAGPSVLTDGRLDPAKINPIAAKYHIEYETPTPASR